MRYESAFKEQFSLAYARAVAAVAGCDVTVYNVDVNGCDIGIHATDDRMHARLPKVDAQVKCTSQEINEEESVVFDLDVRTYRKLRQDVTVPRILIVVLVPRNPEDWIAHSEEEMAIRHCGYWRSLYDLDETANVDSVRVRVPRTQVFTPDALLSIMEQINEAGRL
jgi:hypothetical protein